MRRLFVQNAEQLFVMLLALLYRKLIPGHNVYPLLRLMEMHLPEGPVKTRVFLSYSRKDSDFTVRLAQALEARGYVADYDRSLSDPANIATGISAEDEWWQRLQDMIASADAMVFIVTPDSAASKTCDEEIAYARGIGKRIIPILQRQIDFTKAPPRLSALNVKIEFLDEANFGGTLDRLCAAVDLDVGWYRERARLTKLALDWNEGGQQADALMRPADIKAAERLFGRRPRNAELPALLSDCLEASRARLEEEVRRFRRTTGRAFLKPAIQSLAEGRAEEALRFAAAGAVLAKDIEFDPKLDTGLWPRAARAMLENRTRFVFRGHEGAIQHMSFSPSGHRAVTGAADNTARLWDAESGAGLACLRGARKLGTECIIQPGRRIHSHRVGRQDGPDLGCPERRRDRLPQRPRPRGILGIVQPRRRPHPHRF
jgi:hypothetical protein